jgi:quercetin dioxygenase-like cupin family protein
MLIKKSKITFITNMKNTAPVTYKNLSTTIMETLPWGSRGALFSGWGWDGFTTNGFLIDFEAEASYSQWANIPSENLCLVEGGEGTLSFNGIDYPLKKGYVFKIFPGQEPIIKPKSTLTILSVQMPNASREKAFSGGEDLSKLKVVNPKEVKELVYEYEALGQELITCNYENGLGIIKLTFSIDKIPLHKHPTSGRLIRTISGQGYTYVHPELYELNADDFSLFPKDVIHTNGPVPGSVFSVYAYHLPWVPSGIDEEHIAGNEAFVQYEGPQLPKQLWKTKEDFYRTIKKLTQ